jgi:hypothetical protein
MWLSYNNQLHMTSDQFHVPRYQFFITRDQINMTSLNNVMTGTGHGWSLQDWSRKPQDPFIVFKRKLKNFV